MKNNELSKIDSVYLFTMNVPKNFMFVERTDIYLEMRAQFLYMEKEEPKIIIDVDNLNLVLATNIKWSLVQEAAFELAKIHFKTLIEYANRNSSDLREQQS